MTPFEEARQLLAAATTETQFRTVASRAYFAGFTQTIALAKKLGFTPTRTGADHGELIGFLKGHRSPLLVRIGQRLRSMRVLRNRAEYDMDVFFPKRFAQDLVSDVEHVETWIKLVEAALAVADTAGPTPGQQLKTDELRRQGQERP